MNHKCPECGSDNTCYDGSVCLECDWSRDKYASELPWLYPAEHPIPETHGLEIIAEFTSGSHKYFEKLQYRDPICSNPHWWSESSNTIYDGRSTKIKAYMIYRKPTPPVHPQGCPYCKSEMEYVGTHKYNLHHRYVCRKDGCRIRSPERNTKELAIEALNSMTVKGTNNE